MALRICFVTESYYPPIDGSAIQIRGLGGRLADREHKSYSADAKIVQLENLCVSFLPGRAPVVTK